MDREGAWHSSDAAIQRAAERLQELIRARFPTASFSVARGEDPEGTYVYVVVDTDDLTTVLETVADQLFTFQVEQDLPIYVVPQRPLHRTVQGIAAQRVADRRPRLSLAEVHTQR
jgi:hypothetical protein